MTTYKAFWPEIFRIWAQWLGIALAAIPSGLLLGILQRDGINSKVALAAALATGFLLALVFWVLIGRLFTIKPTEYTLGVCTNVISLERADGGQGQSFVSLYSFQSPSGHVQIVRTVHHAIPEV